MNINLFNQAKKISLNDFLYKLFFSYTPTYSVKSRLVQIFSDTLQYQGETILFDTKDNTVGIYKKPTADGGFEFEYYIFGCEHEYNTVKLNSCLTKLVCFKCGYTKTIDSSD